MQRNSLPTLTARCGQPVRGECLRLGRVLKHTTVLHNSADSGSETSAVVAWPIVLAAPPRIVCGTQSAPALAGRMRNDRPGPIVLSRVARFVPRVDVVLAEVGAVSLYK